jgi:hypothetical protein
VGELALWFVFVLMFKFWSVSRLVNGRTTIGYNLLICEVYSPKLTESCCIYVGLWVEIWGPWDTKPVDLSGSDPG